jgi:hypothetical protein
MPSLLLTSWSRVRRAPMSSMERWIEEVDQDWKKPLWEDGESSSGVGLWGRWWWSRRDCPKREWNVTVVVTSVRSEFEELVSSPVNAKPSGCRYT